MGKILSLGRPFAVVSVGFALACGPKVTNVVGDVDELGGNGGEPGSVDKSGSAGGGFAGNAAGSGGSGVGGTGSEPAGGQGGIREPNGLVCDGCQVVAESQLVRGIASNQERVYWVDYGGFDDVDNYLDNGRLLSRPLTGGDTEIVAQGLTGPFDLGLGEKYAYVVSDLNEAHKKTYDLYRVPLAGGDPELLQSFPYDLATTPRWLHGRFAFGAGKAYWIYSGVVYYIDDDPDGTVETFFTRAAIAELSSDDSGLYFGDDRGLWVTSYLGGEPALLNDAPFTNNQERESLTLEDDFIYAIGWKLDGSLPDDPNYLMRLPKGGGNWTRLASFPLQWNRLQLVGDHYFGDLPLDGRMRIMQGSLDEPATLTELVSAPFFGNLHWPAWHATAVGVFFSDLDTLYLAPVTEE
jgi:hypothetical protein